MSVIGDNIANINTVGFKRSRQTFAEAITQSVWTTRGVSRIGTGSTVQGIDTMFIQGSLDNSGSPLDVAVSGKGFFQVAHDQEKYYTRDGSFHLDEEGSLVNSSGLKVQGYQALNGTLTSKIGDISADVLYIPQQETSEVVLTAVMSAESDFATTPYSALAKTGTPAGASFQDLSEAADFSTSTVVYDSLGRSHEVSVFMERTGPQDWTWSAIVDGSEVDLDGDGIVDGELNFGLEVASGTFSFDGDGALDGFTETATAATWSWPGADPFSFTLKTGMDASGNETEGQMVMAGSQASVTAISQDGFSSGGLSGLRVNPDGVIFGDYSNGTEVVLGQIALALFPSDYGLDRIGGNLYRKTLNSGEPALSAPESGGRGATSSYALERSNVDLETEFVNMIQAQRAYQANTGVIRTANMTLQELVRLI
jgi:flagellar hook protein FlgE